jgi:hypothetical protein
VPVGFDLVGDPDPVRLALAEAMRPAPPDVLVRELSKVEMLTKRRQGEAVETKMLIAAYLERLSEVPADMALYALKEHPNRSPWFPAWHEIQALFADALKERRLMLEATN